MSSLTEAVINSIQGEGVISTLKHYTLNCNETNRHWLDTQSSTRTRTASRTCSPSTSRSSALAAQLHHVRLQQDQWRVRLRENHHLLNEVLKDAWGYPGWVMSDWGATARAGTSR
jgi:beta-glucosidase